MRQLLTILISLSIVLTITGCTKSPENTMTKPSTTAPQAAEPTTEPTISNNIQQKPMYAVSFVPQTEIVTDSAGEDRFFHSYQNISVILPEPEIADKIILDQLNRMDQAARYAEELKADSLNSEFFNGIPFMYRTSYTPMRFDAILFSLQEEEMIFTGGIHPNTYGHFYTYDLLSAERLKLSDVLADGIAKQNVIDRITENIADTEFFWDDYINVISELFEVGLHDYESWFFSNNGLCFYFDPYVLAPYAAGPITVEIPYSKLVGTLKDEYFPAEADNYQGNLVVTNFTVDAQNNFTQFAEAVLTENASKLLLSAEGVITDISIIAKTVEDGSAATVIAVQTLTPGDAIMIEYDSATTKLFVKYRNSDCYEVKNIDNNNGNIIIS